MYFITHELEKQLLRAVTYLLSLNLQLETLWTESTDYKLKELQSETSLQRETSHRKM